MKAWIGLATIFGAGLGVGFLAGARYGQKKEIDRQNDILKEQQTKAPEEKKTDEVFEKAKEAVKEYAEEDFDMDKTAKEMDEYLEQTAFPGQDDEPEEDGKYIRIVGEAMWDENTEYAPSELRYFREDEQFADENDERLEDPEESIGKEAIRQLKEYDNIQELYVLNEWTMEIFRISVEEDSYARAILGAEDDFEFYRVDE